LTVPGSPPQTSGETKITAFLERQSGHANVECGFSWFFLLVAVGADRAMLEMEKDFDSKLKVQGNSSSSNGGGNVPRSKSFAFRAPQENYTIQDFELGKIYGVGSYSKVSFMDF